MRSPKHLAIASLAFIFVVSLALFFGIVSSAAIDAPAKKNVEGAAKGLYFEPFPSNTRVIFQWAHIPLGLDSGRYKNERQRIEHATYAAIQNIQSKYLVERPLSGIMPITLFGPLVDSREGASHVARIVQVAIHDEVSATDAGSYLYECRKVTLQLNIEPIGEQTAEAVVHEQSFEDFDCTDPQRLARAMSYTIGLVPQSGLPSLIGKLLLAH